AGYPTPVRKSFKCSKCGESYEDGNQFCDKCDLKETIANFSKWTSGNDQIDEFIQTTQRTEKYDRYLEFIPSKRFTKITPLSINGFGKTYFAYWPDGRRWIQPSSNSLNLVDLEVLSRPKLVYSVKTRIQNSEVTLKSIGRNISETFLNKVKLFREIFKKDNSSRACPFYGFTKNPISGEYFLVTQFSRNGSLRTQLSMGKPTPWSLRISVLHQAALYLNLLHKSPLVHGNLHPGNILIDDLFTYIDDPASLIPSETGTLFGVWQYVAPEILQGSPKSKESDIYAFGIVMWELAMWKMPFAEYAKEYNINIGRKIIDGWRPPIDYIIPKRYSRLMQKCWYTNPEKRPSAKQLVDEVGSWDFTLFTPGGGPKDNDAYEEFKKADEDLKLFRHTPFAGYTNGEIVFTSQLIPYISTEE
ncbi:18223_t:CDS:2, partial [Acaulospora morrowiae]